MSFRVLWCSMFIWCGVMGCHDDSIPQRADQSQRYVSLSPAMTAMLVGAHMGDELIGRSAYCREAIDLPVAGDLEHVNAEMIVRLNPTHIFVQRSAADVDARLAAIAVEHGWEIVAHPLRDLQDVHAFIQLLPQVDDRDVVQDQCRRWTRAIEDARRPTDTPSGIRVMLVSGSASPLAWGGNTYLGEMVSAAGGINVLPDAAWRSVSYEDIARFEPTLLLVIGEHGRREDWPSTCGRVVSLSEAGLDMPGPHLANVRQALDELLASDATTMSK